MLFMTYKSPDTIYEQLILCLNFYSLNKMAVISQTTFLKSIFLNDNICIQMSRMFILNAPFDTKRVLVQIMAWRRQAIIWTKADPI